MSGEKNISDANEKAKSEIAKISEVMQQFGVKGETTMASPTLDQLNSSPTLDQLNLPGGPQTMSNRGKSDGGRGV